MGVVNVTPDSFSDGGRYLEPRAAIEHGLELAAQGAAIIDVGGESTRPGATAVEPAEELRRVIAVVEGLVAARIEATVSIDTSKLEVARAALDAGATFVNDVTAFRAAPGMAALVAQRGAECALMHMQGEPRTMQDAPRYGDVVGEVKTFLAERREAFRQAGGDPARVLLDPGIGFGKDSGHNLSLLKHLDEFAALGPLVLGVSRKSFLGRVTPDAGPQERLEGSLAVACWGALRGVNVLRVHDVRATRRALAALDAVMEAA